MKIKTLKKWLHNCSDCVWRGSLEHDGEYVDFYTHYSLYESYIGRSSDEPSQYISMPKSCLLSMVNELGDVNDCGWIIKLLYELAIFDSLPIGSAEYGFKLKIRNFNELRVLLNPFFDERQMQYIESIIKFISNKYLGQAMDDMLLYNFSNEICKIIQYQISIER